jgi:hypothetical protein
VVVVVVVVVGSIASRINSWATVCRKRYEPRYFDGWVGDCFPYTAWGSGATRSSWPAMLRCWLTRPPATRPYHDYVDGGGVSQAGSVRMCARARDRTT